MFGAPEFPGYIESPFIGEITSVQPETEIEEVVEVEPEEIEELPVQPIQQQNPVETPVQPVQQQKSVQKKRKRKFEV